MTSIIEKTPRLPVFLEKFFNIGQCRGRVGSVSGVLRNENDISGQLEKALNSKEYQIRVETERCITLIRHAMIQPETLSKLIKVICEDSANDALKYRVTLDIVLAELRAGMPVNLTQMYEQVTETHKPISLKFLRNRIQPFLLEIGVLRKNQDNSYSWAKFQELAKCLEVVNVRLLYPDNERTAHARFICSVFTETCSDLARGCQLYILAHHPRAVKRQDGSIEIVRKPFTKPYTPGEMKILEKRKASALELRELAVDAANNEKAEKLKARAAARTDTAEVTAIYAEASKRVAEINAQKAVVYATAVSYAPFIFGAALLVGGFYMANRAPGNGEQIEASFGQVEQAPNWASEILNDE